MGKGMSGPVAMDVSGRGTGKVVEDGSRGRSGGGGGPPPLAVNKASSKIAKGVRRPMVQQQQQQQQLRAAPQIYKTAPSGFRSLVQQLTGTSSSSASSGSGSLVLDQQQQQQPGPGPGPVVPTKPAVSRLQRIAPPPLRPTFAYTSSIPQQQPHKTAATSSLPSLATSSAAPPGFSSLPFGGGGGFSPPQNSVQKLSPFPVSPLSFSPLPVLTPSDQVWVSSLSSLESPKAAALQQQQLVESAVQEAEGNNLRLKSSSAAADAAALLPPPPPLVAPIPSRFPAPLSPKFAIPFGLPSPTGLGISSSCFGMFGMSPSTFSPTTLGSFTMDASFSFPEPDTSSMSGPTLS
ncbi:hypothetical protein CY35_01G087000 [Sphagnum magellanicum]|jgi:hypothetical protein|nr:hypothetical protein CY35_01G087000 [Sphagnum magellanicum]